VHITQAKSNPTPDEPTGFLRVDRGIVNLASDSDRETYNKKEAALMLSLCNNINTAFW